MRLVLRAAAGAVAAVTAAAVLTVVSPDVPSSSATATRRPPCDAVCTRVRGELSTFTGWLRSYGVKGYVGEVGWPDGTDATAWNNVAENWYRDADAAGLWVTAWATGEWWGTSYPLSVYEDVVAPAGVDRASAQATVVEAHDGTAGRGVDDAGAEFGAPAVDATSSFSNVTPGTYGRQWHYDGAASFGYLAARGVRTIRLPFRWERVQPVLGGPLDATELQRLRDTVAAAHAAGLGVVLDVHNYAGYYLWDGARGVRRVLGSDQLTKAHFVDLWRRLSVAFKGVAGVAGYDLMNEPVGIGSAAGLTPARRWEIMSQAALDAIRANGDTTLVLVPGYEWSGVTQWTRNHPRPWIVDPAANVRYEAHHYFDADHSGTYARSYASELALVSP